MFPYTLRITCGFRVNEFAGKEGQRTQSQPRGRTERTVTTDPGELEGERCKLSSMFVLAVSLST